MQALSISRTISRTRGSNQPLRKLFGAFAAIKLDVRLELLNCPLQQDTQTQAMAEALKNIVTRALESNFQLGLAMLLHVKESRAKESKAEKTFDAPTLRQLI